MRVTLSCVRIPDLDDDIELDWFLARSTTVLDVVNGVIEELDLTKVIPGPGGGTVDYVLEEVWVSRQGDEGKSNGSKFTLLNYLYSCNEALKHISYVSDR